MITWLARVPGAQVIGREAARAPLQHAPNLRPSILALVTRATLY